jgi:hypothetical protein
MLVAAAPQKDGVSSWGNEQKNDADIRITQGVYM